MIREYEYVRHYYDGKEVSPFVDCYKYLELVPVQYDVVRAALIEIQDNPVAMRQRRSPEPEAPAPDSSGWLIANDLAQFMIMHTNEIKYMCMLGKTIQNPGRKESSHPCPSPTPCTPNS